MNSLHSTFARRASFRAALSCAAATAIAAGALATLASATTPKPLAKPKLPPPCVPATSDTDLWNVGWTADLVSFCLAAGEEKSCWDLELTTSRWLTAPVPRAALAKPSEDEAVPALLPARRAAPYAPTVTTTTSDVTVCHKGASVCVTFRPKTHFGDYPIGAILSDDGARVVLVTSGKAKGDAPTPLWAEVWAKAPPKRHGRFRIGTKDAPCANAWLLGDVVMVSETVCEGPGESSWLATITGKRIAKVGGKDGLHTHGTHPARVSGDVWAFNAANAEKVVFQNVKTGAVEGELALPKVPEGVDLDIDSTSLVSDGKGNLAVVYGSSWAGTVLLVDGTTRTITRTLTPPTCR